MLPFMKPLTKSQKIIISISAIVIGIIIWQLLLRKDDITNSISNSLKDTIFVNYVLREQENKLLKEQNEELKKLASQSTSQKIIYLQSIDKSKENISNNEKINYNNVDINYVNIDSTIINVSNNLTKIRLGN